MPDWEFTHHEQNLAINTKKEAQRYKDCYFL